MKAKFGAIVTDGRGKLSGHVFQQGRAGATMKTKQGSLLLNTKNQSSTRSFFSSLSSSWSNLSSVNRQSWEELALQYNKSNVFGAVRHNSGFNVYIELNSNLHHARLSLLAAPLFEKNIPQVLAIESYMDAPGNNLFINLLSTSYIGYRIIIYATPRVNKGVSSVFKDYKKIASFTVTGQFLNITAAYLQVFPSVPSTGKMAVGIRFVDAGGYSTSIVSCNVTY